jgi:murein DD-endopeptidase MepM/ murein hydrolase activator NlpD
LAGIPARVLGAIEYGLLPLDTDSRARLSPIFDLAPELLRAGAARELGLDQSRGGVRGYTPLQRAVLPFSVLLLGVLLFLPLANVARSPAVAAQPTRSERQRAPSPIAVQLSAPPRATPTRRPTPSPTRTATPTPPATPTPAFTLGADGPHGCPLAPNAGHVVITQGYGEGTHAPGPLWGALDLAIDGDGDGNADPEATRGVAVVATHGGNAHVFLDSWPGGNYVRVEDADSGWSTAYAHLDTVAVADGQRLADGATLGTVGSTGFASGPHLHYEVWRAAEHIDPAGLLTCQ